MRLVVALAVVPLLLLAACGSVGGPGAADLDRRTFLSTAVTEDGRARDLVPGSRVSITFDDGRLSASAGCNTMTGGYRVVDQTLVVDALGMTEMGCPGDLAEQDEWLSGLLGSEPAAVLDGDTLTVTSASTTLTLQDRAVADPDRPLVGTEWRVDSLISGDAVSSTPGAAEATMTFQDDGRVLVNAGCNRGSGSYTLDGSTLTIGPVALTRMYCSDERGELEEAFLAVLDAGALEVDITAASLTLTGGDLGLGLRAD